MAPASTAPPGTRSPAPESRRSGPTPARDQARARCSASDPRWKFPVGQASSASRTVSSRPAVPSTRKRQRRHMPPVRVVCARWVASGGASQARARSSLALRGSCPPFRAAEQLEPAPARRSAQASRALISSPISAEARRPTVRRTPSRFRLRRRLGASSMRRAGPTAGHEQAIIALDTGMTNDHDEAQREQKQHGPDAASLVSWPCDDHTGR